MQFQPFIQFLFALLLSSFYLSTNLALDVYCLGHCEFEPPDDWSISHDEVVELLRLKGASPESVDFAKRILATSDISHKAAWPPSYHNSLAASKYDHKNHLIEDSRAEFRAVAFGTIERLLLKAGKVATDVDFLIVNCSLFSPTPSLCAMTMSHFRMRPHCLTYNLSGQGCSANVVAVELGKKLVSQKLNGLALIVSTEIISQCLYEGTDRSMIISNILFRSGCSALLLSSKGSDVWKSPYKMLDSVRSQLTDGQALHAVYEKNDEDSLLGVHMGREISEVAGRAMRSNFMMLLPRILPWRELCRLSVAHWILSPSRSNPCLMHLLTCLMLRKDAFGSIPSIFSGIDHLCVHTGGKGILDAVQKSLKLTAAQIQPSREVLWRYGNTSSSSIWYELAWLEQHGRVKEGDKILQLALGSGFKCNTAVWLALH